MQYLHCFEQHTELYTEISAPEFKLAVVGDTGTTAPDHALACWSDISEREIQQLVTLYNQALAPRSLQGHIVRARATEPDRITNPGAAYLYTRDYLLVSEVYKLQDEWYYVKFQQVGVARAQQYLYYRCDQWVGLVACVNHFAG